MPHQIDNYIEEFKSHFDSIYLSGIARLLDEEGMLLSYLLILTAVESLAGLYAPKLGSGERFKLFINRFFPSNLSLHSSSLWKSRNLAVHAFNPGPIALVLNQPQVHLSEQFIDVTTLDVKILYEALAESSMEYFKALKVENTLQLNFSERLEDSEGGGIQTFQVVEY